ncbi:hypothetical protein IJ531_04115 [bacterium]|nr:hypothetical protein [bacterium]
MKSKIDIVFLVIFFVFLFVPLSHIDKESISKQENRTLAKFEPLFKNGKVNFNFPLQFSEWFNDRFFLRKQFISIYSYKNKFNKKAVNKVIIGREGWLFLGWKSSIASYSNSIYFTKEELTQIDNFFREINEFCKNNNKKFLIVIPPDKSKIYGEFYSDLIKQKNKYSRAQQLVDYINSNSKVPIVYLQDVLLENKKDELLYYKHDSHWNQLGGYIGYREIMRILNLKPYTVKKYTVVKGKDDLNNMLDDKLKIKENVFYKVPDTSDIKAGCRETKNKHDTFDMYCNNPKQKLNLLMYQDSFILAMRPYFEHSFKVSDFRWNWDIKTSDFKDADIIIFEMVERELGTLIKKINKE